LFDESSSRVKTVVRRAWELLEGGDVEGSIRVERDELGFVVVRFEFNGGEKLIVDGENLLVETENGERISVRDGWTSMMLLLRGVYATRAGSVLRETQRL